MTETPMFIKPLRLLVVVLIPLILILGSIRILTSDAYLGYEYNKPGFPPDLFGFSMDERLKLGSAGLLYVREPLPIGYLAEQKIKDKPAFNDRELSHMEDVQRVFQLAWKVGLVILALFGLAFAYLGVNPKRHFHLASALQTGGVLAAGMITLIGLLAIVGWEKWFTVFHTLFFQPGTWTFAFSDTLIRLYPMQFWFDSALTVAGFNLIGGIIIGLIGKYWKSQIGKAPTS